MACDKKMMDTAGSCMYKENGNICLQLFIIENPAFHLTIVVKLRLTWSVLR